MANLGLKDFLKLYKKDEIDKILAEHNGRRFLKLLSLSRKEYMESLADSLDLKIEGGTKVDKLLQELFSSDVKEAQLNSFIRDTFNTQRKVRVSEEDRLYSELYKLKIFDWGGFHQNNVEKTIIDNYVKRIKSYEELLDKIENEINPKIKGYVTCSWYNHWTSILIEDMFKEHPNVLPTIGLIKKIDFFWNNVPYDLKVTHFPDQFMNEERKRKGLPSELSKLKQFAKENDIYFDSSFPNGDLFAELLAKIEESTSPIAREFLAQFYSEREEIIRENIEKPSVLMQWFYEYQGVRRFDSANRLFLVLVDLKKLEDSWKLKRNKDFLKSKIKEFLGSIELSKGEEVPFTWEGEDYIATAQILFIVKE